MPLALITGASQGLGRALARRLAADGWQLIIDARHPEALTDTTRELALLTTVLPVAGDVSDAAHRAELAAAVGRLGGRLDLLVNNASTLGPTPLPALATVDSEALLATYRVNVVAPLQLIRELLPAVRSATGTVLSISSDAAVEHYEGWGVYGSSKAALDHVTLTLAAENPDLAWYVVDPGDMRTQMQQAAFPGEDINDRPLPETVVPALLNLLHTKPPSGRHRAADWHIAVIGTT